MVTFTSSSTVTNFVEVFRQESRLLQDWMSKVSVACIGPITAKTAEDKGLSVSLTPEEYTIDALTHAIVQYFRNHLFLYGCKVLKSQVIDGPEDILFQSKFAKIHFVSFEGRLKNILNNSCRLIIFQEKKPTDNLPDGWLSART